MTKKIVVLGFTIVTLFSLVGNILASQIEPIFAGQPYILWALFIILFIATTWLSLRETQTNNDKGKKTKKGQDANYDGDKGGAFGIPESLFKFEGEDAIILFNIAQKIASSDNRNLPPRLVRGGRLVGRANEIKFVEC